MSIHLAITPDFHIVEGYLSGGNIADPNAQFFLSLTKDKKSTLIKNFKIEVLHIISSELVKKTAICKYDFASANS